MREFDHPEKEVGPLTWEAFSFKHFDAVLSREMSRGNTVYSAAYIMPSGGGFFGHQAKHQNHLRMLEHVVRERFPARLRDTKCMADAFTLLKSIPFVGPFLAYQYVTDMNYSELTNFDEDEFVVAGPGALDENLQMLPGRTRTQSSGGYPLYVRKPRTAFRQTRHRVSHLVGSAPATYRFARMSSARFQSMPAQHFLTMWEWPAARVSSKSLSRRVRCLRRGIPPSGTSTRAP